MGLVIEFPADAASRRLYSGAVGAVPASERSATILILPSIRIERDVEPSTDRDPQEGVTRRRRRRRARS